MYQIINDPIASKPMQILRSDGWNIPFASDNADYQTFKRDLTEGVELQDAEGNVMTPEQVTAFLDTLP